MRVGLVTPAPDHPLLAATSRLLRKDGHEVFSLDPRAYCPAATAPHTGGVPATGPAPAADGTGGALADVYLLKARTPQALALARALEEGGAPVLNSASATACCQNRVEMADLARAHGLPFAETTAAGPLADIAADGPPEGPLVIKSLHSRRDDLVARADTPDRLRELAAVWPDEPVVVQKFIANSGWDHKLWVIDGRTFAGLRHSELAPDGRGPTLPLSATELPPAWTEAVARIGEIFALDVYGVDILDAGGGTPLIVDINAFPGIRGQAGAPQTLADLTLRTGAGLPSSKSRPPGATSTHPLSCPPPQGDRRREQDLSA